MKSQNIIDRLHEGPVTAIQLVHLADDAENDDAIWAHVAAAINARSAVDAAARCAMREASSVNIAHEQPARPRATGRVLIAVSGWAVAAVVTICLLPALISSGNGTPMPRDSGNVFTAGETTDAPPQPGRAMLASYIASAKAEGRLVDVLPLVTLSVTPTDEGVEVLVLRSLLERHRLDALYDVASNEHGRTEFVRQDPEQFGAMSTRSF